MNVAILPCYMVGNAPLTATMTGPGGGKGLKRLLTLKFL